MASRRSHAAYHSRSSISAVSRGDTYLSETHCKLRRSAAVGQGSPHPLLVPQSGTDYHPQHHRGCVSPPSGNSFLGVSDLPTAALLRSLQWVFIIYVPLRGTRSSNSICWSFVGAWLRRDAIASYICHGKLIYNSTAKLQFICEIVSCGSQGVTKKNTLRNKKNHVFALHLKIYYYLCTRFKKARVVTRVAKWGRL